MSIQLLADIFLQIILMTGFGVILKKKDILTERMQDELSALLIRAVLPISVLASSQAEYSRSVLKGMLLSAAIATVYYIISFAVGLFISRLIYGTTSRGRIFVLMNVFANVGFIGMPLAEALCGKTGFLYAVIYNLVYQAFLTLYGIPLLDSSAKKDWYQSLKDPLIIVSAVAIILFILPFRFPVAVTSALDTIGGMMVPLSMMIIGGDLAKDRIRTIISEKEAFIVCGIRLLLFPIIMMIVLKLLGVETGVAVPMILLTALPCGSLNVILAKEYHCEPEFASRTVILSMILMIVTLPLILASLNWAGI